MKLECRNGCCCCCCWFVWTLKNRCIQVFNIHLEIMRLLSLFACVCVCVWLCGWVVKYALSCAGWVWFVTSSMFSIITIVSGIGTVHMKPLILLLRFWHRCRIACHTRSEKVGVLMCLCGVYKNRNLALIHKKYRRVYCTQQDFRLPRINKKCSII